MYFLLLQVKLPVDPGVVLLDIAFTESNPDHGTFPNFLRALNSSLLSVNVLCTCSCSS